MSVNLLEFRRDRQVWNHKPVSKQTVRRYIAEMSRLNPLPNIVLLIDPISTCSEVRAMRAFITARLHCGSENACVEYTQSAWKRQGPPPWRRVSHFR